MNAARICQKTHTKAARSGHPNSQKSRTKQAENLSNVLVWLFLVCGERVIMVVCHSSSISIVV